MIAKANNLPVDHISITSYSRTQVYTREQFEEEFEETTSTQGSLNSNSEDDLETHFQVNGAMVESISLNENFTLNTSFNNRHQELKELLSPVNFSFSEKEAKKGKFSEMLGDNYKIKEEYLEKRHIKRNLRLNKLKIPYRNK